MQNGIIIRFLLNFLNHQAIRKIAIKKKKLVLRKRKNTLKKEMQKNLLLKIGSKKEDN